MFIDKYYELYPGVKNYMDMIKADAYDCGYVPRIKGNYAQALA